MSECFVADGVFYTHLRCYAMKYVIVSLNGHTHYFYYCLPVTPIVRIVCEQKAVARMSLFTGYM